MAEVLAHTLWWSRLLSNTGRSPTTASSAWRVGAPRSKWSIDQPPPRIQPSGLAAAYSPIAAQRIVGVFRLGQVALEQFDAGADGVHVRVLETGSEECALQVDDARAFAGLRLGFVIG